MAGHGRLLVAVTFASVWLCVALGQVSKAVETASNMPMPLVLLPFLSSGFVPTDSMPAGLGWSPSTSRSRQSSKPCAAC